MMISAYGMMLLFASNQARILDIAPYPPFGIATVSYIGLASYLLLMSVYLSARSVAQDVKLRSSIRHSVEDQSRILETIGRSEMEQEIEKRVKQLSKDLSFSEQLEIQSSLQEEDIRDYLNTVIDEVKAKREKLE
jgi:hypothetical protein